jgi:NADH:ubiquinone reductase (H+-translocating)
VNSPDRKEVPVTYDYLILATGVRHSYFGHAEFEKFAPGLKGVADEVPTTPAESRLEAI